MNVIRAGKSVWSPKSNFLPKNVKSKQKLTFQYLIVM